MSVELKMLLFTIVLGVLQLLMATTASTMRRGLGWNLSARDEKKPDLTGIPGRMDRSFKNLMETFVFFVGAVLALQLSSKNGSISSLGSEIYFGCRLIYVPIYIFGIPVLRTLVWTASMIGLFMILFQICS